MAHDEILKSKVLKPKQILTQFAIILSSECVSILVVVISEREICSSD